MQNWFQSYFYKSGSCKCCEAWWSRKDVSFLRNRVKLMQKVINLLFMEEIRESEDCFVFSRPIRSVGGKLYKLLFKHKLAEVHLALSQDPWIRNQVKPLHKQQQVVNDPNIRLYHPHWTPSPSDHYLDYIFLGKKREYCYLSNKIDNPVLTIILSSMI